MVIRLNAFHAFFVFFDASIQTFMSRRITGHIVRRVNVQFHASFFQNFSNGTNGHPSRCDEGHGREGTDFVLMIFQYTGDLRCFFQTDASTSGQQESTT